MGYSDIGSSLSVCGFELKGLELLTTVRAVTRLPVSAGSSVLDLLA